ncbi:MAG: hypothetical protein ACK4MM_02140 [Fervidobacterium sp.]
MQFDPRKYREEKEKEIRATYGNLRKRSFRFLILNVMIVLTIFFFLMFLNRVSPQIYSNIADALQLTVELTKLEYLAPESVGARIYVVNTKRSDKNFVLSDFYVKVYSQQKTLFEFSYQTPVEGTVRGLAKRLIYDLGKEVNLSSLEDGSYNIFVTCKINGKEVKINRTFTYKEEVKYGILTEPFYLLNEVIKPYFVVENRTSVKQNFQIIRIQWQYGDEIYNQVVNKTLQIYPSDFEMIESPFKFSAKEISEKELEALLYFSDGTMKQVKVIIPVVKEMEGNIKNVDFSLESLEPVLLGKSPKVNLYILNQINNKRYLKIEKLSISIPSIGYSFEIGNRRFYLIPFGKAFVTRLESLSFEKPGVYEVIISIYNEKGETLYQKKMTLAVGK